MAKSKKSKKPKRAEPKHTTERKDKIRTILKNADYIEQVARQMYDSGQGVSITKVYHHIKGRLGLPGYYEFDSGDAIKDILREAGWERP